MQSIVQCSVNPKPNCAQMHKHVQLVILCISVQSLNLASVFCQLMSRLVEDEDISLLRENFKSTSELYAKNFLCSGYCISFNQFTLYMNIISELNLLMVFVVQLEYNSSLILHRKFFVTSLNRIFNAVLPIPQLGRRQDSVAPYQFI